MQSCIATHINSCQICYLPFSSDTQIALLPGMHFLDHGEYTHYTCLWVIYKGKARLCNYCMRWNLQANLILLAWHTLNDLELAEFLVKLTHKVCHFWHLVHFQLCVQKKSLKCTWPRDTHRISNIAAYNWSVLEKNTLWTVQGLKCI